MAKTDSRIRREREAARQRAEAAAREDAHRRAARRRGLIGIGVVVGVVLAVFGVIKGAGSEKERKAAATSTTAAVTTSTLPPADLPAAPPGGRLAGAPPCPAADGSAARITHFEQAPPDCLDPAVDYGAVIRTSKGPLLVDLDEATSRDATNAFVFLSGYHYYDGLPVTTVRRGAWAEVGDPADGPGFSQAATGKNPGGVMTSLLLGLTPRGGRTGGGLTIGMPGDQTATIAPDTTPLGLILDARPDPTKGPDDQKSTLQLINDTASPSGAPTGVTTIERIELKRCPKDNKDSEASRDCWRT